MGRNRTLSQDGPQMITEGKAYQKSSVEAKVYHSLRTSSNINKKLKTKGENTNLNIAIHKNHSVAVQT